MSINKSTLHLWVRWFTDIFIGISCGFLSACYISPFDAKCCQVLPKCYWVTSGWASRWSWVICCDCGLSDDICQYLPFVLLHPTVTQCWRGCRKFIFFLLGAWPGPSQTCIACDSLSLFRPRRRHFLVDVRGQPLRRAQVKSDFFPLPSLSFSFPPLSWPCVPFCYHLTFNNRLADLFWGSSSQIKASEPNPSSTTPSYLFHICGNSGSGQIYQLLRSSHVNLKTWSFCTCTPLSQVRPRQLAVSAQTSKERDGALTGLCVKMTHTRFHGFHNSSAKTTQFLQLG